MSAFLTNEVFFLVPNLSSINRGYDRFVQQASQRKALFLDEHGGRIKKFSIDTRLYLCSWLSAAVTAREKRSKRRELRMFIKSPAEYVKSSFFLETKRDLEKLITVLRKGRTENIVSLQVVWSGDYAFKRTIERFDLEGKEELIKDMMMAFMDLKSLVRKIELVASHDVRGKVWWDSEIFYA